MIPEMVDDLIQLIRERHGLRQQKRALNLKIDRVDARIHEINLVYEVHTLQNPICHLRLGNGYESPHSIGDFPYLECMERAYTHLFDLFGEIPNDQSTESESFHHQFQSPTHRQYVTATITLNHHPELSYKLEAHI